MKAVGDRMVDETEHLLPKLPVLLESESGRNERTSLIVTLERMVYILGSDHTDAVDLPTVQSCVLEMALACHFSPELASHIGVQLSECIFLIILQHLASQKELTNEIAPCQKKLLELLKVMMEGTTNDIIQWRASCVIIDLYILFGDDSQHEPKLYPETWMFSVLWNILETKLNHSITQQQEIDLLDKAAAVGRLVCRGRLKTAQLKGIGAKFMSLLVHSLESVVELVKTVIRQMRKVDHETVADCLLDAMMERFDQSDSATRESFLMLCQKISSLYVVFNNAAAKVHVYHFVNKGIQKAMEAAVPKFGFITEGLSCFTSKLSGRSCEKLKEKLKTLQIHHHISQEEWKPMEPYIRSLAVPPIVTVLLYGMLGFVGTRTETQSWTGRGRSGHRTSSYNTSKDSTQSSASESSPGVGCRAKRGPIKQS